MKTIVYRAFLLVLLLTATAPSAEFDIDAGRVVLRQIQYCTTCGSALLVNGVPAGVRIRCPDCGGEEPRIADEFLLSQLYQLCRLCAAPLDAAGRHPGDAVECDTCHTRQLLSRDAFALAGRTQGPGFAPGFPPGTGEKVRLLARPAAPPAPVPLPEEEISPDGDGFVLRPIPRPPGTAPVNDQPPLPGLAGSASGGAARKPLESLDVMNPSGAHLATPAAGAADSAFSKAETASRQQDGYAPPPAIEVPAVTADLFGGPRKRAAEAGASGERANQPVARVDDVAIHAYEVDRVVEPILARLREADAGAAERAEPELRRQVLERLIERELVMREAEAIGFRPDPAAVRERENELARSHAGTGVDIRREAIRDVTMQAMRRRFGERPGAVTPAAVREFYREHRESLRQPRLVALDQLAIFEDRDGRADPRPARSIAMEIAGLLEQGRPFAELRDRYDEFVPATGVARMEPPLQPENVFAGQVLRLGGDLRRGAVFGPLAMPGLILFGKVVDERPEGPIPFEEVEKEILRRLESEAEEHHFAEWLDRLRQRANITIHSL